MSEQAHRSSRLAAELAFDRFLSFPEINIARVVEEMIERRGVVLAAEHAALVARVARQMNKPDVADDWDEVCRLIIARR
jgi:hypothetical protein